MPSLFASDSTGDREATAAGDQQQREKIDDDVGTLGNNSASLSADQLKQAKYEKLLVEHNALQAKVDRMEQEQQQQHNKGICAYYGSVEKFLNAKFALVGGGNNCWDANACHNDLQITGPNRLTVHCKGSGEHCLRSVLAKCSASFNYFGIFYFEVKVERMKDWLAIGLDDKPRPPLFDQLTAGRADSFKYSSDGTFRLNGLLKKGKPPFSVGDVIGCGINLHNRRLFFTKNGQHLDVSCVSSIPSDYFKFLFPCVSLPYFGDQIEANFGPHFQFDAKYATLLAQQNALQAKIAKMEQEQQLHNKGDNDQLVVMDVNCWDPNACDEGLEITGRNCLTVHYKEHGGYWMPNVSAKCSVPPSDSGIFYYELKVERIKCGVDFGIAVKPMPFDELTDTPPDSYKYSSDGQFVANDSYDHGKPPFAAGDTVGCGIDLAKRQLFFTKNGQLLDDANVCLPAFSTNSLFPRVTLWNIGDQIEANFGPHFQFDVGTFSLPKK